MAFLKSAVNFLLKPTILAFGAGVATGVVGKIGVEYSVQRIKDRAAKKAAEAEAAKK